MPGSLQRALGGFAWLALRTLLQLVPAAWGIPEKMLGLQMQGQTLQRLLPLAGLCLEVESISPLVLLLEVTLRYALFLPVRVVSLHVLIMHGGGSIRADDSLPCSPRPLNKSRNSLSFWYQYRYLT